MKEQSRPVALLRDDEELSWNDLTFESQKKLLDQEIIFQGQKIKLSTVLNLESVSEKELYVGSLDLDSKTIIQLATMQTIVLGANVPGLMNDEQLAYYIDRKFYQIEISRYIENDVNFRDELAYTESDFDQLCKEHPNSNIHWLRDESGKLIWQRSQGSVSALSEYVYAGRDRNN